MSGTEKEQGRETKKESNSLQALYNRRRELKRAVKDIERLIEEETKRLKATSAQN